MYGRSCSRLTRPSEDERPVPRSSHGGGGCYEQPEYRGADSAEDALGRSEHTLLILIWRASLCFKLAADRNHPPTGRISDEQEQQQSDPAGEAADGEPEKL